MRAMVSMRRVVCREIGPPERLEVESVDAPEPGAGQVVVAVRAAGVNFVDALLVAGKYQIKMTAPFTPGSEVAGEIVSVGEGVTPWSAGDRVAATTGVGGFAEQVAINARSLRAVPDSMTFGQAATFVQSYETMLFAFTRRTSVRRGETVLVLGRRWNRPRGGRSRARARPPADRRGFDPREVGRRRGAGRVRVDRVRRRRPESASA